MPLPLGEMIAKTEAKSSIIWKFQCALWVVTLTSEHKSIGHDAVAKSPQIYMCVCVCLCRQQCQTMGCISCIKRELLWTRRGGSPVRLLIIQTLSSACQPETSQVLLQGFVSRDRRKAHVREADEKLLEAMAEQPDGEEGEPSPGGHAPLLADVVRNDAQFEALVKTARVLLACGRAAQAAQLVEDSILHFGRRWQDRYVTIFLGAKVYICMISSGKHPSCIPSGASQMSVS